MDEVGNILIKRVSKSAVRVKNTTEESAVSNDILKQPGGLLENDKPFKVSKQPEQFFNEHTDCKRVGRVPSDTGGHKDSRCDWPNIHNFRGKEYVNRPILYLFSIVSWQSLGLWNCEAFCRDFFYAVY